MRQSAAKDEVLTANFIYRSEVTQREITNGVHRGTLQLKRGMTTVRPAPAPHAPAPHAATRRNRPPPPAAAGRPNPYSSPSPGPNPEQEEVCKLVRLDVAKLGEVFEIPSVAGRSMVRIRTAPAPHPHCIRTASALHLHCICTGAASS